MPHYTQADIGCWIDGAYGLEHAYSKLASMLDANQDKEIIKSLRSDNETEASDALEDTTAALANHTEPGLVWHWVAGDLCLMREDEAE